MGNRAGYRCREGEEVSPMLRKQWSVGNTREQIETFVRKVAKVLMDRETEIGGGAAALRDDLDIGRLFAAMVHAIYSPPFDSINKEISSDI